MKYIFVAIIYLSTHLICAQNTVGTLVLDEAKTLEGYTLFTPNKQSTSYLVNNCGQIINQWSDNPMAGIGADQYLLEDGSLLIAKFDQEITAAASIGTGGAGGIIEIRSWDNILKWRYIIRDSLQIQHHDIHMMPNGNILAIVLDRHFLDDIVEMGFDTTTNNQTELWPDKIVEIDTSTNEVVWEWRAWDHLIQDYDATKSNFGSVSDNPQLIDINYQEFAFGRQDWMHSNSIDYNAELDQILISVRNFQEIWIVDHSTTTAEAATHLGGTSGRGGDLLYRWGNDFAFKQADSSDERYFFYQHDAAWLDETYHSSSEYYDMISVYNNFIDSEYSLGVILNPILEDNSYEMDGDVFLPNGFYRTVSHPDTAKQRSAAASNFQLLPNGNFLLHAGRQGRTMELTEDEVPVWEYFIPMRNGVPIEQGAILDVSDNFTFSGRKYAADYVGLLDKDLNPQGYIELAPSDLFCNPLSSYNIELDNTDILYPNPVKEILFFSSPITRAIVNIYNSTGERIFQVLQNKNQLDIDVSSFQSGIYFLECNGNFHSFIKD